MPQEEKQTQEELSACQTIVSPALIFPLYGRLRDPE